MTKRDSRSRMRRSEPSETILSLWFSSRSRIFSFSFSTSLWRKSSSEKEEIFVNGTVEHNYGMAEPLAG